MSLHIPSLTDRGSDAHQIRRLLELAHVNLDHAVMRAQRSGFGDLHAGLQEIVQRTLALRESAEIERRAHTPAEFRRIGEMRDAEAQRPTGA